MLLLAMLQMEKAKPKKPLLEEINVPCHLSSTLLSKLLLLLLPACAADDKAKHEKPPSGEINVP
jgi:hypothetical protein